MRCFDFYPLEGSCAKVNAYLQDNCTELEMVRWKLRPAMLVIPGGAYAFVAEREGEPIALKFSAMGYQAFVLSYTLNTAGDEPVRDAEAALKYIRSHAEEWHVDVNAICVTGYSAGGNLALRLIKRVADSCPGIMPKAMILGYPAVTGRGCIVQPMNGLELDADDYSAFPPSFIWTTQEDEGVDCSESVQLWARLNGAKVPAELHVYQRGKHGYSTADKSTGRPDAHVATWLPLCMEWLEKTLGL